MRGKTIIITTALWIAGTFCAGAQPHSLSTRTAYRVYVEDISVHAIRSRRTDTNYASVTVQVGRAQPQTIRRRLGDMGKGIKAINMAFPHLVIGPRSSLKITWAIFNYGEERQAALVQTLQSVTEQAIKSPGEKLSLAELSEAVSDGGISPTSDSCNGPVMAGAYEISGAALMRQTGSRRPLRIARRQMGLEAPAQCGDRSDYSATFTFSRERTRS